MLIFFSMLTLLRRIESKVIHRFFKMLFQNGNPYWTEATLNDIKIVYDSDHYIVLDKRHDIIINDSDKSVAVTVEKQLTRLYPDLVNPKLGMSFYFCHRLDYSTSGILCIAKHKQSCSAANKAFKLRKTKKYYLAIVRGHVSEETLSIKDNIGADIREHFLSNRMAIQSSQFCSKISRDALTHIAILEKGICYDYPATKILMRPITGRRHQLRLHCSSIGHTIVGDYTYSDRKDILPYRMFLHAFKLVLPSTVEPIDIQTNDPFTSSDVRNSWISIETITSISDAMNTLDQLTNEFKPVLDE